MGNKNIDNNVKEPKKFSTKTDFSFHSLVIPFLKELNIEAVAIDIGYNGLKTYSIYGKHLIPSLPIKMGKANRLDNSGIGSNPTYILYKDENDFVWFVGDLARDMIDSGKKTYNYDILYGRNRTTTPEYQVLLRTGIALSLIKDMDDLKKPNFKIKTDNLKVMTGLPEDWMNDKDKLISVFTGVHKFSLKIGNSDWIPVSFELNQNKEKDVYVMSQPKGTIFSLATSVYGQITKPELLLSNNVLVFDGGFGTNDIYYMKKGQKASSTSFTDNAMVEVYKSTCADILQATKGSREIRVYEIDKYIETDYKVPYTETVNGKITKQTFDFRQAMDNNIEDFAGDAFERMNNLYQGFQDVDYVICTGGTGEAYHPHFERDIPTNVILAENHDGKNPAENFTPVYSNVIGFFCNLVGTLKKLYSKNSQENEAVKEVASTSEKTEKVKK